MDSPQRFIACRRAAVVKLGTISLSLAFVRRVVNLAVTECRDREGLMWLEHAAKIKLFKVTDRCMPFPLSCKSKLRYSMNFPTIHERALQICLGWHCQSPLASSF
jgi:hypothetical protein